ncbi:hypothetical protein GCM10029964_022160 [Kibdelosporangium lantanae]
MLHRALRQTNLDNVTLIPEPVAVAENHAVSHDVVAGQALAVYDLGAGSLSTAVVRRSPAGTFELLSSAESVEPNGGDSFDDVIFEHIRAVVAVDMADPHAWTTLTRMRQLSTQAKESLSTASEATVREIQVTRTEFEDLIRPAVEAGVEELLRTIRSAPVSADDIASVVITGGSSRIPWSATCSPRSCATGPCSPPNWRARGEPRSPRRAWSRPASPPRWRSATPTRTTPHRNARKWT